MAYSEERVRLVFDADAKRAKAVMQDLQKQLDSLMNSNSSLDLSERFTKEVKESQVAIAQLKTSLNGAFNANTGKLDLSKFHESMQKSGMSLQKYQKMLSNLGPAGDKAFSQLALSVVNSEIPLKRSSKLLNEMWTTMKNTARWQLSASMLQGFTSAIQKAYNYAQDLNESLNNIRIVTNASVEDMARFAVEANKSAKALSTTTTEYTNASLIYYQQGLSAAEVKERTDVTIKMANVARESAETISDQMTAVWNNFADGSKTLEYYADVMTALGAATASSTAEITTGLEKFAAVAETVGLSYEYATTALATITDTTRQSADVVGNALKTLFARIQGLSLGETLEDGTDLTKYSEALAKVGIAIKEQDGSLKDMDTILDEMANKWGTLAKDQQVALAQTVAGVRQYTQLVALMDNWDKFQKNLSVAQGAEGALQEQSDIYAESWEAARDRVKAAAESIYDSLLNDEFFIDLADGFAKVLNGVETLSKTLGGLPGILTIIGVAFNKIFSKQLISGINNIAYSLKMLNPKNQQPIRNEKIEAVEGLKRQANNRATTAGSITADLHEAQGQTLQNYVALEERLTEEQKESLNLSLQTQNTYIQRASDLGKEVDLLETENEHMRQQLVLRAKSIAASGRGQMKDAENFEKRSYSAQAMNKAQARFMIEPEVNEKNLERVKKEIESVLASIDLNDDKLTDEAKTAFEALKQAATDSNTDVKALDAALDAFFTALQTETDQARNSLSKLDDETEDLSDSFDELENDTDQLTRGIRKFSRATADAKGYTEELDDYLNKLGKGNPLDLGTKINYLADSLGSVAMLATSVKGIFDTWKNEDLSFFDKLLSTITTLSFVAPMAINSLDKLYKLILNNSMADLGKDVQAAGGAMNFLRTGAGGAAAKIGALLSSAAPLLIMLAALTPIVIALVKGFKELKEQSPEGKLEKASETAKQLASALSEAEAKASELKSTLEGYENARKALDECVKGTDEWNEALATANAEALKLLELYPELYSNGGVKRNADGLIEIDTRKIDTSVDTNLRLASAYANQEKRTAENNATKANITKDLDDIKFGGMSPKITEAIFNLAKEKNGAFTRDELMLAIRKAVGEDKLSSDQLDKVMNLQPALAEWVQAINANTLATEIENETIASEALKDKGYDDSVIEAIGVSYNSIIDKAKADIKSTALGDDVENYFKQYAEAQGIKDASDYNASKGTYKYKDENGEEQEGELTYDALLSWVAATTTDLTSIAERLNSTIGDNYELKTLTTEGLAGLSLKQQQNIAQNNQEELANLIDMGVITQEVVNQLNQASSQIGEKLDLEETLSANLQQIFKQAFGDSWADGEIGQFIASIPESMRDHFGQAVAQTDWTDVDSAQAFGDLLTQFGVSLPEAEINKFIVQMMDANDAVKSFNLDAVKEEFYDIKSIISELEKGDTISLEDYAKLTEAEKEYFTLTSDGTYMLTEDAKKFYDTVMGNRLEDAKEKITELQGKTQDLEVSIKRFNHYGGDVDSLTSEETAQILYPAGKLEEGMDLEARREAVRKLIEEYEGYQTTLEETQEFLGASARSEAELSELLGEDAKNTEIYQKHLKRLNIELAAADKALQGAAKGIRKFAPEIEDAMEALSEGMDATDPVKYRETLAKTIEKYPEWAGAIYAANDALLNATPGTEAYYQAWKSLYDILATAGATAILDEQGEKAADALEVIDSKTASLTEKTNAIANLNMMFGEGLFSPEDIGTKAFDDLRKALDGDVEAYERLRKTIAENQITTYYGAAVGSVHLEKLWSGLMQTGTLAKEVEQALLDSGMFKLVETWIDVPISESAKESKYTLDPSGELSTNGLSKADRLALKKGLSTKKQKVTLLQPIDSKLAVETFNPSGSSSSSGSGSKGTKKNATDEKERYHVISKQIEGLQAKYDKAGKEKEKAFGPAKESAALTELGYLDQLIEKERQYKAEIEQYLATDKSALAKYGATFGEHGEITNYDALMDQEIAKYNAAIEKAGTNQEAQEAAEKAYDLFIKALETYEGTYSAYLDKLATIQDLQDEKIDKELQNIQDKLDAKLNLEADQLKYLDYLIGKLDDEAYALADALVSLHDKTQPIMNQSDHYADAWEELQRTAEENGVWTQDMIDKLRELRDGLISTNEEMMELQKTIEEKVNEAIAECTDELDKQISRFDTYQSILQNYNDIIDLSGKKFKDYAMMLELSSLMTDNAINKLASSREKLETLGQAQVNAQTKLELAEDSGDQDVIDYWKKTLEDIQIEVENATAEMGSAWKEALQSASDAFESQVNLAIDNFKGGLEAFGDLDMISDSYDRAEKAAERYLEDFEKTYELSQLGRDITKAMNDATSAFAKDELAELMAEVNEKQKDGVKMSEYDLEVLKKKFELKQAELALEEAQNSMSQVRLTRDNEGNWSYQYTADQDKVDEALNEYETRLYEVAKLSDEYIDEMSQAIIDNQKDMYEALAGLRAEDFASYKEYETAVRDIVNFYTSQDAYLRDELAKAVGDTETITTQMSTHYNNLSTSFTTVVDTMLGNTGDKTGNLKTWMESTDNLAEQAEEYFNTELPKAYEKWEESVANAMEAAGTSTEDFKDDVSGYMEDIGDASEELADDIEDAADDMQDYIEDVMDAVWDWQEEYSQAIQDMINENERLIESMMAVAAAQGAGSGDGDVSDYSLKIAELISQGATMDSEEVQKWLKKRANKTTQGGIYDEDNANIISNEQLEALMNKYVSGDKEAVALVDKVVKGQAWLTDDVVSKIVGFATGGYTGAWGPEGKIAMVHEKELVLNSDDTVNFLAGVNILREIAKMIDLQAANMAMPHGFTLPTSTSSGGALEQNVHISASFPGVQDRNEIEIALRSLVNEASQFVLE